MTPEERTELTALCSRISVEKDATKFTALLKELDELLEAKSRRFAEECRTGPQS